MSGLVSVVVPSYRRHHEVIRAVRSVLVQSYQDLEVIVVNDGPDEAKRALLESLSDERVRYLEAPPCRNPAATRNAGIRAASGAWIALLDDDDAWRPQKLEIQLDAAKLIDGDQIVAGVEQIHDPAGEVRLRPARQCTGVMEAERLLFPSGWRGTGGVNTSTLMARALAFRRMPMNESLERHEDWQWLLDVGADQKVMVVPEVVCDRWLSPGAGVSRPGGFDFTWSWYQQNKMRLSARARVALLTRVLSRKAAVDKRWRALPDLVRDTVASAGFSPRALLRLSVPWVVGWGRRSTSIGQ